MKLQNTPELNPGQGDQQTPYNTGPATPGAPGIGVPAGGTTGQVLTKSSNVDFATGWTTPSAGGGGVAFAFGTTAPTTPTVGDLWVDSNSGIRYEWVNDGTSTQWVEF